MIKWDWNVSNKYFETDLEYFTTLDIFCMSILDHNNAEEIDTEYQTNIQTFSVIS